MRNKKEEGRCHCVNSYFDELNKISNATDADVVFIVHIMTRETIPVHLYLAPLHPYTLILGWGVLCYPLTLVDQQDLRTVTTSCLGL